MSSIPFARYGITLAGVQQFIVECGGRDILLGKTTTQICDEFVKPKTARKQQSYCCHLRDLKSPNYGPLANVFICHAWKYFFLDVVEALLNHFQENINTVIWFDLFCTNQHNTSNSGDRDFRSWEIAFKSRVNEIGHVVMVLSPWNNPIPLKRAWCLFELYCSADESINFEIAMTVTEKAKFLINIVRHPGEFYDMLGVIDVEKSEAFLASDEKKIKETINANVGCVPLNRIVLKRIADWVLKELDNAGEMYTIATILDGLGRFEESEVLYKTCLDLRRESLGRDHPDTINTMNNLGLVYNQQGRYHEAEKLHKTCSILYNRKLGVNDTKTMNSMNNLANVYVNQERYDEAEALYTQCLALRRANLGPDHPATLDSMNNLANVFCSQGRYEAAEDLYNKCLELYTLKLGPNHPDTLRTMNNLACLYDDTDRYTEAETMYTSCVSLYKSKLGENHPNTKNAIANLSSLYRKQGNFVPVLPPTKEQSYSPISLKDDNRSCCSCS